MKNHVVKIYMKNLADDENYKPPLFQVWLHNDDFTPKEFVVKALQEVFYFTRHKAMEVMVEAHAKGKAFCGVFAKDFAETKISQIEEYAKEYEQPMLCSMESA